MCRRESALTPAEKLRVAKIWNNEYPSSLRLSEENEFDNYLMTLSEPLHYLIENEKGHILAWACKFKRDNEKWFAIIIDRTIQGKGNGTALLNALKDNETALSGWVTDKDEVLKFNGDVYKSPLNFYLKNGFIVHPEIRLENEKMSAVKISWTR